MRKLILFIALILFVAPVFGAQVLLRQNADCKIVTTSIWSYESCECTGKMTLVDVRSIRSMHDQGGVSLIYMSSQRSGCYPYSTRILNRQLGKVKL